MRIVIDLQGAQAVNRSGRIGRYSLSMAVAIARRRGDHHVIVALNGTFADSIEPIRAAFDGVLPQADIRIWQAPGNLAFARNDRSARATGEMLREAFLASLRPDLV